MNAVEKRRYGELLRQKHPHVIRTESENEEALREVEALLSRGDALSLAVSELLAILTVLVERFEEERYAMSSAPPREILRELMSAHGMTQKTLSGSFLRRGSLRKCSRENVRSASLRHENSARAFECRRRYS